MEYLGGGSALDLVSLYQNTVNDQFHLQVIMTVLWCENVNSVPSFKVKPRVTCIL